MYTLARWEQTGLYDPTNPGQMINEHYTGLPGGYSSFYYNRIPSDAALAGTLAAASGMRLGVKLGIGVGALAILYMAYGRRRRKR